MTTVALWLDRRLSTSRPSVVAVSSATAALAAFAAVRLLWGGELPQRLSRALWEIIHEGIRPLLTPKIREGLKGVHFPASNENSVTVIPTLGWSSDRVMEIQKAYHRDMDQEMNKDLLSGVVYWGSKNHHELLVKVVDSQLWSNALFPDYFGASRRLEAEVVAMILHLFHAPADACATFTGGGTESILLAMLAYRNEGRARGIAHPEVVLCRTAHQAFDKAAEYFSMRLVKVDVDPRTMKADTRQMRRCVTPRTVCVVGSAPCYAYGVIDDLDVIAGIATDFGIGMHVDSCLGGFLTAFYEDAGLGECVADFRIQAVTSVSCDIHKWGGAPKGCSVVMFRSKGLRSQQVFACTDNPGGLYTTAGMSGSRPGFSAALAWATLVRCGKQHYVDVCRAVVKSNRKFADAVRNTPHMRVLGSPQLSIVAMASNEVDVYCLMEIMKSKGFRMSPLQFPAAIHLGLTLEHAQDGVMERLVAAFTEAASKSVFEKKETSQAPHLYGTTQRIPDRSAVGDLLRAYADHFHSI